MFSLLRMVNDVIRAFRPSREEWNKASNKVLTDVSTAHLAKCTLAVRRGLLPEEWKEIWRVKLSDEQWKQVDLFHEKMLATDAEYKKEYLVELELERTKYAEYEAKLREQGYDFATYSFKK